MKTLYFHIGWRKTGTSAIQSFIMQNTIGDSIGDVCVIPVGQKQQAYVVGGSPVAHHRLAAMRPGGQLHPDWAKVTEFVAQSVSETFLITSELVPGQVAKHPTYLELLATSLSVFERIVVLFWVRRQDEYLNSLYVQAAKHGKNCGEPHDLDEAFPDSDYFSVVTRLENAIPRIEFRPHFYAGLRTDVIGEMIHDLDLDGDRLLRTVQPNLNARVSPEMYRAQIEVNKRARITGVRADPAQRAMLRAYELTESSKSGELASPLSVQERVTIVDLHRESNRLFCSKFAFSESMFELPDEQLLSSLDRNIPDRISAGFYAEMRETMLKIRKPENELFVDLALEILQNISE